MNKFYIGRDEADTQRLARTVRTIADYGIENCVRVDLRDMEPFALREIDIELKQNLFEAQWTKQGITDVDTITVYFGRILPTTCPEYCVIVVSNTCYNDTQMLHALHEQTGMPWTLSAAAVEESNRKIREYLFTTKLMFALALVFSLYGLSFQQLP